MQDRSRLVTMEHLQHGVLATIIILAHVVVFEAVIGRRQ